MMVAGSPVAAILRFLMSWCLPSEDRAHMLGELDAMFARRVARSNRVVASMWYVVQLGSFLARLQLYRVRRLFAAEAAWSLRGLLYDLRFSVRRFVRRPGYFLVTAMTLGVGVGGLGFIYSAANWVLLRPVPGVSVPDDVAVIRLESQESTNGFAWAISHPDLQDMARRMPSVRSMAAAKNIDVHLQVGVGDQVARMPASLVTVNFLETLGVAPARGRFFQSADYADGIGTSEVVISWDLMRRFSSENVVGMVIDVNDRRYLVIGVAPPGFRGAELPGRAHLWFPETAANDVLTGAGALTNRGSQLWDLTIARPQEGVTTERIEEEANTAMARIRETATTSHSFLATHFVFRVHRGVGLTPRIKATVTHTLSILGAGSVFLLALAILNVTNVSLARASGRRTEATIRRVLGAGAGRIVREQLVEGLVIGLVGAVFGMVLVSTGSLFFADASLSSLGASLEGMIIDARVIVFIGVVAVIAGVVAACAPALSLRAIDERGDLRRGLRSTSRVRTVAVVVQVALSTTLLVGAGLMAKTVLNLSAVDLGFSPKGLTAFSLDPSLNGFDSLRVASLVSDVRDGLLETPGVDQSGFISPAPFQGWYITAGLRAVGANPEDPPLIAARFDMTPGTIATFGFELIAGEDFRPEDSGAIETPIIVSESAARALVPGQDPRLVVGRTVMSPIGTTAFRVVGVIRDARFVNVREEPLPLVFRRWSPGRTTATITGYLRSQPASPLEQTIRESVRQTAPSLPAFNIGTVQQQIAVLNIEQRVVARLAMVLAGVGLLLSAVGLYGVVGQGVVERTHEIGIRGALGARPSFLVSAVVRRGVVLAGLGAAIGVPISFALTGFLEALLFGVDPSDPIVFLAGPSVLLAVSTLASWIPARRAARISPVDALRSVV